MQLLAHSDRVFTIPGFLDGEECSELIALAESAGFASASVRTAQGQQAMPQIRNNERAMVESSRWVQTLWQRLAGIGCPVLSGEQAVGLPKALRFYRYTAGQRFKMHKDGPWTEEGRSSRLTFLVYLNEAFEGGATDFRDFQVTPHTGHALLFIHDTWHEGAAVTQGVKYVLRSDVLYAAL